MHPCRIFQQAKAATQSGIANTGYWRLEFDTELQAGRFENELIGWASRYENDLDINSFGFAWTTCNN